MRYVVNEELLYRKNGASLDEVILSVGAEVDGIHLGTLEPHEAKVFRRIEMRQRKTDPSVRMGFFQYEGVIRCAILGKELIVKRRQRARRLR